MKLFTVFFAVLLILTACLSGQCVNGDTTRVDKNLLVLRVWGTHQERGFSHGYLLAPRIKDVFENYILSSIFYNNAGLYNTSRSFFETNFYFRDVYLSEAGALIQGIEAAGESTWCQVLGRDVDSIDILMASAIDELVEAFNCASLSSWGPMTASDTLLQGTLVITRMMDWTSNSVLKDNHLIIVHYPQEPEEQPWISIAYSGFVSALSAVNFSGLTSFKNMGNSGNHPNPTNVYPALLASRDAVESSDYNSDGTCDVFDVISSFRAHRFYGSSIIHTTKNHSDSLVAAAVECDNGVGDTFRTYSHDPALPFYSIICTNHFRILYPPVYCYRYKNISDSIISDSSMSAERSWNVMAKASGVSGNSQMIQWIETSRTLKVSTATSDSPAYLRAPVVLDVDSLFNLTGVEEENGFGEIFCKFLTVSQNFTQPSIVISYSGKIDIELELSLFDALGRKCADNFQVTLGPGSSYEVFLGMMPSGVFFLTIAGDMGDGTSPGVHLTKKIFSGF